ncbi:hypothetical protein [Demequina sp.]|uniref:hypothetical protein n=1 Tax=Demequina sp. TaxID=2050685 RepID=UPI003D0980E4
MTPETSARELTVLAWRRTSLRWVVVAVVGARLFAEALGWIPVALAAVTILVSGALSIHISRELGGKRPDADHSPVLRLAAACGLAGLLGLVALWWLWVR